MPGRYPKTWEDLKISGVMRAHAQNSHRSWRLDMAQWQRRPGIDSRSIEHRRESSEGCQPTDVSLLAQVAKNDVGWVCHESFLLVLRNFRATSMPQNQWDSWGLLKELFTNIGNLASAVSLVTMEADREQHPHAGASLFTQL